jgi:hypothetical protein
LTTFPSKRPGEALKAILISCGDPLGEQMAKSLGVTTMTIYRWKKSKDMALSRVEEIANYHGMSIEEFLTWGEI